MSRIIAVFAVLAILTGAIVLGVPRQDPAAVTRSGAGSTQSLIATVRDLAEQANAPLSIVFGLISLYYSRRTYLAQGKK